MNPNRKIHNSSIFFFLLTFFVGILIGLVLLGWWLWPVRWTDSSIDSLNIEAQQDYLRAAIDSYSHNLDVSLAQERYHALGDQKENIIAQIIANPGSQEVSAVEQFITAVQAQPGQMIIPAPSPTMPEITSSTVGNFFAARQFWIFLCLAGVMVFFGVLVILVVLKRNRKKKTFPTQRDSTDATSSFGAEKPASNREIQSNDEFQTAYASEPDLSNWLRDSSAASQQISTDMSQADQTMELSDADIDEITSSSLSSLEIKPVTPRETLYLEKALLASEAFVLDEQERDKTQETLEETFVKLSREIDAIPGIDPETASQLKSVGITAPILLLKKGASPSGRQAIAAQLNIEETQVLKWVNSIDLLRIKGLTLEDAHVLKAAGVDMLVELATRNPEILLEKISSSSQLTNPFYNVPSLNQVNNWITQAQDLPRIISYE